MTGASGFVGGHITRLLVQRGRKVRVLLRRTSNQEGLHGLPVEIFYGDVLDIESIERAMSGCETVFHSVVDPRFWLSDATPLYRNNVEGLVNAMEVALANNVKRFIFTSSMGTLGFNPGGPVTEATAFNWHDRASPYILARLEAEETLLAYCRERGLPGVALCVANTYGPEDFGPTPHGNALWETATGQHSAVLDSSQPTVDIRDVADAALSAERYGRSGERYIIANEYISNRDFYRLACAETGHPLPRFIPLKLAYAIAWVAERFYRLTGRKDYMLRTDAVFLSDAFKALDNTKAREQLHWQPRPLRETIHDALAWFGERHTL